MQSSRGLRRTSVQPGARLRAIRRTLATSGTFSHSWCWSSMSSSFARLQPDACYGGSGCLRTGNGLPPSIPGEAKVKVEPMSASVVGGTEVDDLAVSSLYAAEKASPLAGRSRGIGSREPGTDAQIQAQSVGSLRQAPQADLLPPVPLVALDLLLGHA